MHKTISSIIAVAVTAGIVAVSLPAAAQAAAEIQAVQAEKIPERAGRIDAYQARFGRSRPLIAVIGENDGTELTDFIIPYGVLARSGAADVMALATRAGSLRMLPGVQLRPDASIAEFDALHPEGADYVIVPAVRNSGDAALLAWVAAQGAKGATLVGICDGALVLANSGAMKGHRGTAHWATHAQRQEMYPATEWLENVRYVADGRVVSSAGISAAMPTALALVAAIAGEARADEMARELGVADWSTRHDSAPFHPRFGVNLRAHATRFTNPWFYPVQKIGVPVAPGVDEIALALTVDAYSRTGRSRAYALSGNGEPLRTRSGLTVLPDVVEGGLAPDRMLPAFDGTPPARVFDQALAGIAASYGRLTAYRVALDFEYPGFHD
ncbi:MAG: DJ-1/PfpI family protein [Pseudomonadota bacterium]